MSRDWTPREQLMAESLLPEGKTWRDVGRGICLVNKDGTKTPLYDTEGDDFIYQYDYVGRIGYDMAKTLIRRFGGLETEREFIAKALEYIENRLVLLINTGSCDDEHIEKWFDGKLDNDFYYADNNNYELACYMADLEMEGV